MTMGKNVAMYCSMHDKDDGDEDYHLQFSLLSLPLCASLPIHPHARRRFHCSSFCHPVRFKCLPSSRSVPIFPASRSLLLLLSIDSAAGLNGTGGWSLWAHDRCAASLYVRGVRFHQCGSRRLREGLWASPRIGQLETAGTRWRNII